MKVVENLSKFPGMFQNTYIALKNSNGFSEREYLRVLYKLLQNRSNLVKACKVIHFSTKWALKMKYIYFFSKFFSSFTSVILFQNVLLINRIEN